MKTRLCWYLVGAFFVTSCVLFTGCSSAPNTDSTQSSDSDDQDRPPLSEADAQKAVAERFDAHHYVVQDFIPKPGAPPPPPVNPPRTITLGLYWVQNDEQTPWYVGMEKGFFADEGLTIAMIPGGPNRDTLPGLLAGREDIYIGPAETPLFVVNSRTGADLRMICATMKQTPVGWIGLDKSIPKNQRSTKHITAEDLKGHTVGLDPGGRFIGSIIEARLGLKPTDLRIVTSGATPDSLMGGAVDYYTGFSENQPRVLERNGYMNWTFFPFSDIGYQDYFDVSTVTEDTYEHHKDMLAAYVYALQKSEQYVIDHPEEAAEIATRHTPEYPVTKEEALWRIKKDIPLYIGDGSGLLSMKEEVVTHQVTLLYQYHQLELPGSKK